MDSAIQTVTMCGHICVCCRPSVPANSPMVFDVQLLYIPGGSHSCWVAWIKQLLWFLH
jgi:hypothetical protein